MRSAISIASRAPETRSIRHGELVASESARAPRCPAGSPRSRLPTSIKTSSPRLCPRVSLTCLNPSRSTNSNASVDPSRAARAQAFSAYCANAGPVPEAGQRIMQRVVAQLLLELALLGDVVHVEHDAVAPLSRWVGEGRRDPAPRFRPGAAAAAGPASGCARGWSDKTFDQPDEAIQSPRSARWHRSDHRRPLRARSRAASRRPGWRRRACRPARRPRSRRPHGPRASGTARRGPATRARHPRPRRP